MNDRKCIQDEEKTGFCPPFLPSLGDGEIEAISILGLAHLGDAVYELLTRTFLCESGKLTAKNLHGESIKLVRASAQARAAERIRGYLTEEELSVFKRGRNSRANVPVRSKVKDYRAATGLEALFGWLYLKHKTQRLRELFDMIVNEVK